jgi:antirestriction protein ArdC
VIWRPYLPEPRPAFKAYVNDPEPVPLESLWAARYLCGLFRVPPRQFRQRTRRGIAGSYWPKSDIVAVNPDRADGDGMGGEDGYYVCLLEELLHATGHPSRLDRATTTSLTYEGHALEQGTVNRALRIVLTELRFPVEALDWHAPLGLRWEDDPPLPVDQAAAEAAAAWVLG